MGNAIKILTCKHTGKSMFDMSIADCMKCTDLCQDGVQGLIAHAHPNIPVDDGIIICEHIAVSPCYACKTMWGNPKGPKLCLRSDGNWCVVCSCGKEEPVMGKDLFVVLNEWARRFISVVTVPDKESKKANDIKNNKEVS